MTTFTIDTENNITAFAASDQAEAVIAAGAQPFGSSEELTQLAAGWPAERLVAIWNSLPGVTPAKGFKNPKAAASKIWAAFKAWPNRRNQWTPSRKRNGSPRVAHRALKVRPRRVSRIKRPSLPRSRPKALRLRNQLSRKLARRARAVRLLR